MAEFIPKKWDDASVADASSFGASDKLMGLVGSVVKRFPRSVFDALYATLVHASRHKHGGADEVATATPAANEIPKANGSGKLDSWISDAAAGAKGLIQLAGQIGGSATSPDVRGLRETGGPTLLTLGAVADNGLLLRSGTSLVSVDKDSISPEGAKYNPRRKYASSLTFEDWLGNVAALTWTWGNQGTSTEVIEMDSALLTGQAGTPDSLRCRWTAAPGSGDWVATLEFTPIIGATSNMVGVCLLDAGTKASPTGISTWAYRVHNSDVTNSTWSFYRWTSYTAFSSGVGTDITVSASAAAFTTRIFHQLRYNDTTKEVRAYLSLDGMTWRFHQSYTAPNRPSDIGYFVNSNNAAPAALRAHRFIIRNDAAGLAGQIGS